MTQADPSAPPSLAVAARTALRDLAIRLVEAERAHRGHALDLARMLQVLPLEREGGTRLMRLAEALPRTPDAPTRIALLADKLDPVDWSEAAGAHAGALGAAVRAAMPAARAMLPDARDAAAGTASSPLARALVMPAARAVLERIGAQFVHANDIHAALGRAAREAALHSFDMLGEGARGWPDADRNQRRYLDAIAAVGAIGRDRPCHARQGVSIKLSAIHPRFELPRFARERGALLERLRALCGAAADADIPLNIDAEEHDRLSMTLELFEALARDASLAGWSGLGIVAQAYQRSAASTVATLVSIARGRVAAGGAPIAVRLVKGAYWDAEVKRAQELGLDDYPVFVRKADTDASYARCARALLDATDALRPQFATHNAVTVACVLREAAVRGAAPQAFELQRLHGMGAALHAALGALATRRALPVAARAGASSSAPGAAADASPGLPQRRVYAPVGEQRDLLAYLIRRILENGASTSFVRRFADPDLSAAELVDAELDAFVAPEETAP
jgi:RHH-type proline utilization regulon transcriptional repressor/proline dehydrogenase/delta 1-pyrroline-5-carboxylate dehydrogenase